MGESPRVLRPNGTQLELRPSVLENLLPADHRARAIWEFVEGLDLSKLYEGIRSVEGHAGRPAIDPAILLSLWSARPRAGVRGARRVSLAVRRRRGDHFDGLEGFEDLPRDGRCVADYWF